MLVIAVVAVASTRSANQLDRGSATVSPTPSPTPTMPAESTPLPETGTPDPGGEHTGDSATVPETAPPATPTPEPDPNVWRYEGAVVDEDGKPMEGVCVAIGPHGCQRFSPRTDARGVYFIDLPQVPNVTYNFYFSTEGYATVWHQAQPGGPTTFNVMLRGT